jgi:polyisoprenoid-binding protein YceI
MATFSVDKAHSSVGFTVRHMMFAKVHGQFKEWEAKLAYDPSDATKATLHVEIAVASVDTREAQRDGHLRSADFFDVETFPKMTFQSKRVASAGPGQYKLVGDLTIHGVTHEVTLDVEETGRGKDPWGNERVGFHAKTAINRGDFGLKWNQALEAGGVLVSDKVDIDVEAEVVGGK